MDAQDEKYMLAALKLARRGIGAVEPNPAVGCIIVKSGRVVGKGHHAEFGGPHAEVRALSDCRSLGIEPAGATMYVTLEPCCHQGKTGPCVDEVIASRISRLVIAMTDPAPHVNGKGIAKLREAGIDVEAGCCRNQAALLNAPFVKWHRTGRSWVVLKWAQSIDGKLTRTAPARDRWISNDRSRKDVHRLRRRVQAVAVGINTLLADNPQLNPRPARGRKPLRVILDNQLRTPLTANVLATAARIPTMIFAAQWALDRNPDTAARIREKGAEIVACPDTAGQSNLHLLMEKLAERQIQQLLVEGGPTVLSSFLCEQLVDEISVYIAPTILGGAGAAEITAPMARLLDEVALDNVETAKFGGDVRISGLTARAVRSITADDQP